MGTAFDYLTSMHPAASLSAIYLGSLLLGGLFSMARRRRGGPTVVTAEPDATEQERPDRTHAQTARLAREAAAAGFDLTPRMQPIQTPPAPWTIQLAPEDAPPAPDRRGPSSAPVI